MSSRPMETSATHTHTHTPTDPATQVARILSAVLAPAVSVFLICLLCGIVGHAKAWTGLGWGAVLGTFCAVIPMIAIHLAVRRERLTDHHVTRREQRWWVFLVCVGSVLCGVATTLFLGAPSLLIWILVTMIAGLVVAGTVTLVGPKVSMHTFCLTSLVVLAALLISPWWLLALPAGWAVIAFARLRLNHHTPAEIVLGAVLAVVVMGVSQMFIPAVG